MERGIIKGFPTLIILVGESGAGKSTLCQLIDRPDICYSSSGAIIERLNEQGVPVNHESIHDFAIKKYFHNPLWQVPYIIEKVKEQGVLILDGARRIEEVEAIMSWDNINSVVFKVLASERKRFGRLQERDNINEQDFRQILQDENEETDLGKLLSLYGVTIRNDGPLEDLKVIAEEIREFIKSIQSK